jgi:predicted nucleotidyltransferase component of viral defense system
VAILLHATDPDFLFEAIGYTARQTGFDPRLIEKDYFCSVVLEYLVTQEVGLVFKGGTSLAKIHDRFYRLSEDLDFTISTTPDITRAERSRLATVMKAALTALPKSVPGLRIRDTLTGANSSTQNNSALEYDSLLDDHREPVRVEISISEPTLCATEHALAATALLDPLNASGEALLPPFSVESLSYQETMAEKMRAALCRRTVAIRDFFDVDHAVMAGKLDPREEGFLDLLLQKLAAPRTGPADVSDGRIQELHRQLDAQLKPMLRERDFAAFDLDRAVKAVRQAATALALRKG